MMTTSTPMTTEETLIADACASRKIKYENYSTEEMEAELTSRKLDKEFAERLKNPRFIRFAGSICWPNYIKMIEREKIALVRQNEVNYQAALTAEAGAENLFEEIESLKKRNAELKAVRFNYNKDMEEARDDAREDAYNEALEHAEAGCQAFVDELKKELKTKTDTLWCIRKMTKGRTAGDSDSDSDDDGGAAESKVKKE